MRFRHAALAVTFGLSMMGSPRLLSAFTWPSVPERLARALADEDVQTRRIAAEGLHELSPMLATPLVLRALDDPDLEVRLRAARAAASLRLGLAAEKLVLWLGDSDARIRLAACEVVGRAPTEKAAAALGRVLSDPDPAVRLSAAAALSELELEASVLPLLGRLDDSNAQVRVEVVGALARIGDFRAVFALIGKLGDGEAEVRRAVAHALGELGDPRATGALVRALRDRSPEVQAAVLDALGQLRAEEAAHSIGALLDETRAPAVRRSASMALGQIASEPAVSALIRALDSEDLTRSASPVRDALVRLGSRARQPLLSVLAAPPSSRAAGSAALVLGELRTEEAANAILEAMRRGSVGEEVGLRALARCGDLAAVPQVLEFLGHRRPAIRRQSAETLAALLNPSRPDGRVIEPLADALRVPHASLDERVGLVRALGRSGSGRAVEILGPFLGAKDLPLRLAAIEALGSLGPLGQDALLIEALGDDRTRFGAALALAKAASEETTAQLLERLSLAAEADRSALGIAISGGMARAKKPETAAHAASLFAIAGEAVRDALVEGLGRMPGAGAGEALRKIAHSASSDDRRKAAEALAGHSEELASLISLLDDSDPSVRASAAWSLGTNPGPAMMAFARFERVLGSLGDADGAVVANAMAAAARLAEARPQLEARATQAMCSGLHHPHGYVRANALTGLALLGTRCEDGSREREILRRDPNELARGAAASLLHRKRVGNASKDRRALARCLDEEKTPRVAWRCRSSETGAADVGTKPVLIFVVPDGETEPVPSAPFAMQLADGFVRSGKADRRGAVFEAAAPSGVLRLMVPGA